MGELRFIDLFAGLGGFHVALRRLGHRCVLAAEIDESLRDLYARNLGIEPLGDARAIDPQDLPQHDILCAGFPCQPFSKAGFQRGLNCEANGDLASVVVNWLRSAKPEYFILENVPNFVKHDQGRTWRWLSQELRHAGYVVADKLISAHELGIPQLRERLFIVGSRNGLSHFQWPMRSEHHPDLQSYLDSQPRDAAPIPPSAAAALEVWQEFLCNYPKHRRKPWFPIWATEFGATYPYATIAPLAVTPRLLRGYRGSFGQSLDVPEDERADRLPAYARGTKPLPSWKIRFIQLNRDLYEQNRTWIDPWLPKLRYFEHSFQKFEWNFDDYRRSLWSTVIQLRGSGIRAKSPSSVPTLVSASTTQVPIIAWERRYMTPRECARVQDLVELEHLPKTPAACIRALGNAVNAHVVECVARSLLVSSVSEQRRCQ